MNLEQNKLLSTTLISSHSQTLNEKAQIKETTEKKMKKKMYFLIEVHFLIAGPNGHPSKY